MKVLSFSYCYPNSGNPAWGIFVQQRLEALARRASLQVVSPQPCFPLVTRMQGRLGPASEQLGGLKVHRPRFFYVPGVLKSLDARFYARGLRRWLKRQCESWRPDLLDAHFAWPDGVGVSLLAREMNIPYTITLRGKIYPCLDVPSQRRQCADALSGAAAVISVSGDMARIARELGVSDERLHIIPNGVDTDRFSPRNQSEARSQLGLDADGRLIVTVAHLGPRKGHHETVHALARLDEDIRLVIVGGDAAGERDEKDLRTLIDELGMKDRVILAGRQPYENIPLYFAACDVSVLASYREGCPNVVLESLASGRPVVATAVGAVEDILSPQQGRLAIPRDIDSLTDALQEVFQIRWSAEKIAACEAVKSWREVAEEVHKVFVTIAH